MTHINPTFIPNPNHLPNLSNTINPNHIIVGSPTLPSGQIGEAFKAKKAGKNGSHVILILDESGSMSRLLKATITSANEFISSQKEDANTNGIETSISVYTFDGSNVRCVRDEQNVNEVREIGFDDYNPVGMTNLYDGIGSVIATVNKKLSEKKKKNRPSVIISIITDGLENASKTFSIYDIQKMYSKCNDSNWAFLFMGANIDAFAVGSQMGFNAHNTLQYGATEGGVIHTSAAATRMVSSLKGELASGSIGDILATYAKTAFTDEERSKALDGERK